ncbi:molybdopterin-binding protein [Frankia sp. AgB32]|uniref:TOBE domain-containing protein n=1 Tax=Frankia sp. AgB32 TaxID=631119 RepID=UPI00200EFA8E|nr:TOBE domain-containing protein [Frankia sp. AgB32]MCK9897127.1 TOBE domain-containing protein [Frankia sp. AgB32]
MSLSIRNRLSGTVSGITAGAVMSTVTVDLAGGQTVTAAVTGEAVKELGIGIGSPVDVLVKSSEVALALGEISGISIRNQLRGTVSSLDNGGAMSVAHVALDGGGELTSAITLAAATDLELRTGLPVTALVKSTEVALSTV